MFIIRCVQSIWKEDLLIEKVATKVAFNGDGSERRWVRQAVMGVLRWRDLPGTRSSMGSSSVREVTTTHDQILFRFFLFI